MPRHRAARAPRSRRATRAGLVAAGVLAAALVAVPLGGAAARADDDPLAAAQEAAAGLPARFDGWDVQVAERAGQPGAWTLAYDSPALGQRTDTTVYVPTSYSTDGDASAVLYYLHGTVVSALDNPVLAPVTSQESLVDMVAAGGGDVQTLLQGFAEQRDRARFVVVAPDTDPADSWCETCAWIDGREDVVPNVPPATAETVPAETVLSDEIIPLVESLLNVRTDRGGRGISGFSMGSVGAQIQAFRHPDRYSYVGAISGPVDVVDDAFWRLWIESVGYLRDQGYGTSVTDEFRWRGINPIDNIGNYVGSGGTLLISAGDACLPPTDAEGAADCATYPPLRNPLATTVETQMRRVNDERADAVAATGVDVRQVRYSGIHGANNHRVYADVIVPDANAAFEDPQEPAETFDYRAIDPEFAVWGYDVATDRAGLGSTALRDARHDGSRFTLRGNGTTTVTTPDEFDEGETYSVRVTGAGGERTTTVAADGDGRITVTVDLDDPGHADPAGGDVLFPGRPGLVEIEISGS